MANKMLSKRPALTTCGAIVLAIAFLAGNPVHAEDSQISGRESPGTAAGILETSTGHYEFTPAVCGVYKDDQLYDIEVGGPGIMPDGRVFYFELSSTANEITIKIGADGPFVSVDQVIRAGRTVSQEFEVLVQEGKIIVPNLVLVDENRHVLDEKAKLVIDCGG